MILVPDVTSYKSPNPYTLAFWAVLSTILEFWSVDHPSNTYPSLDNPSPLGNVMISPCLVSIDVGVVPVPPFKSKLTVTFPSLATTVTVKVCVL